MTESHKKFATISVWLTAILLLIRCFLSWVDVKYLWEGGMHFNLCYTFFGFVGEAIGVAAIMMAIFNRWAWKWKWLRWMHNVPELSKTYTGTIVSDHDKITRDGNLLINQSFLAVTLQLKTDESYSRALTATFIELQSVQYLFYVYQNEPRAEIQNQSPMHYGTAMLNTTNPMLLEGNYYTGRNTKGSMSFMPTQ